MNLRCSLTKRENEIAELLAWGASKKEVADRLSIATRTVENTARNIYAKIGIQKATELCVYWFCAKCGVSPSLDPLKRAFAAIALLLIFLPQALAGHTDLYRTGARATRTTVTAGARRTRDGHRQLITF